MPQPVAHGWEGTRRKPGRVMHKYDHSWHGWPEVGPTRGCTRWPQALGRGEGGDSYTMETGLVHRVYLVGIGNSIRVRSYGGEGRREREQRKRRGERQRLFRRRTDKEGKRERKNTFQNSLAFVQPEVSIHSDIPPLFVQSSISCAVGASNLNYRSKLYYEQQPPAFPEIICPWQVGLIGYRHFLLYIILLSIVISNL